MSDGHFDGSDGHVSYKFTLDGGRVLSFDVDRSRAGGEVIDEEKHAPWTRLDFHQCPNCPLDAGSFEHCPAAVDLEPVAAKFSDIVSFERVTVEVGTEERVYIEECDAQTGLRRSLMGLIMSTSGCSLLRQLRVLAKMHLPFTTLKETAFRICGAYLVCDYLERKARGGFDWEMAKLQKFIEELQTVNQAFQNLLSSAVQRDSNLNALGSFFMLSVGLQMSLEDHLEEFRESFQRLGDPSTSG